MNRSVIRNLVVVALIAYPAFAFGQDQAPDVKGKWIGKTHTILVGKGGHWPKGRGTWDHPALLEKDLAFDIRGQDGSRFWGVTTLSRRRGEDRRTVYRRAYRQGLQELRLRRYRRLLERTTRRRRHALVLLHAYPQQVHRGQLLASQADALRGENLPAKCLASAGRRAACSALQNAHCTVCKTEPFSHHGNDVSH